jgi:hypothetical protein
MEDIKLWSSRQCRHRVGHVRRIRRSLSIVEKKKSEHAKRQMLVMAGKTNDSWTGKSYLVVRRRKMPFVEGCVHLH